MLAPWLSARLEAPALFSDPGGDRLLLLAWQKLAARLPETPRLCEVASICEQAEGPLEELRERLAAAGLVWSPAPLPIREPEPYLVRHGAGYTVFEHHSHGLTCRHGGDVYRIHVENPQGVHRGVEQVALDGSTLTANRIVPLHDGRSHDVRVILG
jgi:hypothetical protein